MDTHEGILRYFHPLFNFIDSVVSQGKNVMIHCLAGAHRAGTAATSWLLFANNMSVKEAIKLAKSRRSAIDPIGSFP